MSDEKKPTEVNQEITIQDGEEMAARSPRTHIDSAPLPTDSMVTVPLSETEGSVRDGEGARESMMQPEIIVEEQRTSSRTNSSEIRKAFGRRSSDTSVEAVAIDSPTVSVHDTDAPVSPKSSTRPRGNSSGSGSGNSEQVDWAELEKKEEQEPDREEEVGHPHIYYE